MTHVGLIIGETRRRCRYRHKQRAEGKKDMTSKIGSLQLKGGVLIEGKTREKSVNTNAFLHVYAEQSVHVVVTEHLIVYVSNVQG